MVDSACLRGRGEKTNKKGTSCVQWGTSVQKVMMSPRGQVLRDTPVMCSL